MEEAAVCGNNQECKGGEETGGCGLPLYSSY